MGGLAALGIPMRGAGWLDVAGFGWRRHRADDGLGALGFTFGSANSALQLNLRLSAAESNGTVKTISAPKVTTLQNQKASISQGVSIPFSQVSAQGVNTTFVEARLQLDVTPHITSDGSVLMAIKATNNQPDPANTGANVMMKSGCSD